MLIDRLMPRWDFVERHSTLARATPERIYEAMRHGDFATHPIVRLLLAVRGLKRPAKTFSLDAFLGNGFALLADDPPRELVLGVEGPFWNPRCKLRRVTAETFALPVPDGVARGAWNFTITEENGASRVSTETRVLCGDGARTKFRVYWLVVRPFSGLIRILMLRAIRQRVER